MTDLTVYDPPQCCATGVCGTDVDQRLVDFAADLDWLKSQGAQVRRINLSQEPMEFVSNPAIKALMDTAGTDALPAVLVGGALISTARYPARGELAKWAGIAGASEDAAPAADKGCCASSAGEQEAGTTGTGCCGGAAKDTPEEAEATGCC